MATDPDPDLRERVAELEATVEQQQQTIQQLLPSRRRVLQAGGLLAGGGVLGALTADRASADVVGQVGTSQDRVDVFAGAVDANSINTDDLNTNMETTQDIAQPALSWTPGKQHDINHQKGLVGTSTKVVAELPSGERTSALMVVSGDEDGNPNRFYDLVHVATLPGGINVISTIESGTPASRTYSQATGDISLEMASSTYRYTTVIYPSAAEVI